jgi:diguanylate cyclase (GGDEF)-like protein/PAS domain S-box-containing protein
MKFSELVDVAALQALMDSFQQVIGIANAIIDVDGIVITSSGWQDVCVQYHRVNATTCARCIESDTSLVESMLKGAPFAVYGCLNGLVDTAAPIIVDGQHVANVFTGQFFTAPPDLEYFRKQAQEFGFDEKSYLDAVGKVPVISKERIEAITRFYANIAHMLAVNGLNHLRQQEAEKKLFFLNHELSRVIQQRTEELSEKNRQLLFDEEALRESEERWKFALEGAGAGVWDWNIQTGEALYSKRWKEMLGYAEHEIVNHFDEWTKRVHPESMPSVMAAVQAHLDGETPTAVIEFRMLCKDGNWKWMLVRGMVVSRDADGKPLRLVGTNIDLDVRKQAEEALRASQSSLEALFENMSSGAVVYRASPDGQDFVFAAVNRASERIENMRREDMIGRNVQEVFPDIMEFGLLDVLRRVWKSGVGEQFPFSFGQDGRISGWRENYVYKLPSGEVVAIYDDVTARKQAEDQVIRLAHYDVLTDLPNRTLFLDRLGQAIKKSNRTGLALTLLYIDLDQFKEVNDTLGHHVGDALLVDAAQRIVACVRESDTVARLGGDEFTVILAELADTKRVSSLAESIIQTLNEPFILGGETIYISASIGITSYPTDAADADTLLMNADQAMYVAKNSGRNRYSYFTNALQEKALIRLQLVKDLRGAMSLGQFQVHFQPIVELATGYVYKAEALLRWKHPVRGMVGPTEFIPLAEETGLIHEIGDWVFKESVHWAKRWNELSPVGFQVSVNKSPVQFLSEINHHDWLDYLNQIGLAGTSVVVEITEGLLLNAGSGVSEKLFKFRDAGIQVAIDDFGTGYSALSYLKKFDIDYLKIDQSFVRNLATDHSDLALSEAIIVMAHKLGLKVIAEGVETAEQRDLLAAAGCDYAQGYMFSRAMSPEEFEALLKTQKY